MKDQETKTFRALAASIGQFIRYWGFRNIHGEIWAAVFLAENPLSGVEIAELLQVSKSLVSPALHELEAEGLIEPAPSENSKTKRYRAIEDVESIIKGILQRRERPMLGTIEQNCRDFRRHLPDEPPINRRRLDRLERMIQMAMLTLTMILETDHLV